MSEKNGKGYQEALRRIEAFVENPPEDKKLDLSELGLTQIPKEISRCKEVRKLHLNYSLITKLENLDSLIKLERLDISSNQISKLENLESLSNLNFLDISRNQISKLENLESLSNLNLLDISRNQISKLENLDRLINLETLVIRVNNLIKLENLDSLSYLRTLYVGANRIEKLENLDSLTRLQTLSIWENKITKLENVKNLTNLISLKLSRNKIVKLENLESLEKLQNFVIDSNNIAKLENLDSLINLQTFSIRRNQIVKLENLESLTNLNSLMINQNQIVKLENLKPLINLKRLDVSMNNLNYKTIGELTHFYKLVRRKGFNHLMIDSNPFLLKLKGFHSDDYITDSEANHLKIFIRDYEAMTETNSMSTVKLPNKVVLIGNSAAGKSSLVQYFTEPETKKKLQGKTTKKSTPALDIIQWKPNDQPEVFFYDFGGQDFYHASYKLFMSHSATYLLVWSQDSNYNHINDKAEKERPEDYYTFSVPYWLGNIRYLVNKDKKGEDEIDDTTVLLIENKIDLLEDSKQEDKSDKQYYPLHLSVPYLTDIVEESFRISLKKSADTKVNGLKRKLLQAEFLSKLKEKEEILTYQYEAIRAYIDNWSKVCIVNTYWDKNELIKLLKSDLPAWSELEPVDTDRFLRRFRQAGMLLWYEHDDNLKDKVWIKPKEVQKRVRELFKKPKFRSGIVDQKDFESHNMYEELGELLLKQQIFFKDESKGKVQYIIPQALSLKPSDEALYAIATQGLKLIFSLKFRDFMPMGIMNRLICLFGKNPEKKSYSRYEMIFTFKSDYKVWLKCDMINLTLDLSMNEEREQIPEEVIKELYQYCMIAYYGVDKPTESALMITEEVMVPKGEFESVRGNVTKRIDEFTYYLRELPEYKTPVDLLIGLTENYYVPAAALAQISKSSARVNVLCSYNPTVEQKTKDTKKKEQAEQENIEHVDIGKQNSAPDKSIELPAYLFNPFMEQPKPIALKLFISYAHKDYEIKNRFLTHLAVMKRNRLIEVWDDGQITPGENWDERIKKQIERCDVFVMLVSSDFLASQYIWEEELSLVLDAKEYKDKQLFPILVSACDFVDTRISEAQLLPKNPSGDGNLLPITEWPHLDAGMKKVVDDLKIKIKEIQEKRK